MSEGRLARANELRRRAETHLISAGWLSARELLEDALTIYREEGDASGSIGCLRGLGDVAAKVGEPEAAQEYYRQALAAVEPGDHVNRGECLMRGGELLRARGEVGTAAAEFRSAADSFRAAGHRKGEAQCLGLLGELARLAGDTPSDVLELYRQAHGIQMEVGDLRGAAVTLTFMANFARDRDPKAAAEAFVQAARIYEGLEMHHRAEPFLAAARRLDPSNNPVATPRSPGPWDDDS